MSPRQRAASESLELLQGTLDLLVLRTLADGPMHGHAIARHIQRVSEDVLTVKEGSLYPALHRLERKGLVQASWKASENNRRARYYRLTPSARRHLKAEEVSWARFTGAVARVLGGGKA